MIWDARKVVLAAAAVVAVGALTDICAFAQAPGSPGQPGTRQSRPDPRSPSAQAAENYDPTGVPLGSFRLYPELELGEVYNDNIYATSTGRTGSFIQLVKPSVDLRSDWNNHSLNFFAKGGLGFYSANSTENFQDFSLGTDGRLDIQRDWNTYGGLSFNRRHEERGTPNAVNGGTEPTKYNQAIGNLGYYQKFNNLAMRLDGRIDNYSFYNNGLGLAQGVLPNTDRNRTEFREAIRLGYEFSPGYEAWMRGSLNQRRYNSGVDSAGFARNSAGWDVVGGVSIDLGGITSVEVFAGYMLQNYDDSRFFPVQGLMFGATGYWNPLRELWVKPFVKRSIEETSSTTFSGYINTAFGLDVDYHIQPNLRLNAHADYAIADYQNNVGAASRNDQYATLRTSLMYLFTPNFYIGPQYTYIQRTSSTPNTDYGNNIIMIKLGTRI